MDSFLFRSPLAMGKIVWHIGFFSFILNTVIDETAVLVVPSDPTMAMVKLVFLYRKILKPSLTKHYECQLKF